MKQVIKFVNSGELPYACAKCAEDIPRDDLVLQYVGRDHNVHTRCVKCGVSTEELISHKVEQAFVLVLQELRESDANVAYPDHVMALATVWDVLTSQAVRAINNGLHLLTPQDIGEMQTFHAALLTVQAKLEHGNCLDDELRYHTLLSWAWEYLPTRFKEVRL